MSFRSVPAQETILYSEKWTKNIDTFFIKVLVDERNQGRWDNRCANMHAIETAKGWINAEFGKMFSTEEVDVQKRKLLRRYRTFKRIINDSNVKWLSDLNHVEADWSFWKKMFKEKPLSRAYFHKGEAEYERLNILFSGRPESPTAGSQLVITVSSDDDSSLKPQDAAPTVVVISDSETGEEVESPSIVLKTASKKIDFGPFGNIPQFPECSLDEQSTNTPVHVHKPSTSLPPRNAFPNKPMDYFFRKSFSSGSQGSSSPAKKGTPSYRRE